MKKVIITGAGGFIGYHVLNQLLSRNIEAIAVVRENSNNLQKLKDKNIRVVECSLANIKRLPELIPDRDIDTVYHFAWQGVSGVDLKNEDVQLANLKSTLDLVDAAREMEIGTFIGAGSLHEHEAIIEMNNGKKTDNMGMMYKAAKLAAHYMAKAKAGHLGLRFFWPIITNAYGAGENSGRLVNTIIRKIFAGEEPELSEGLQNYDFVHISDVANAFLLIGEKGVDGTDYIIGSGIVRPLREYLQKIADIANGLNNSHISLGFGKIKSNVIFLPSESFSIVNLSRDTGYSPGVSFEQGISDTAEWIFRNR